MPTDKPINTISVLVENKFGVLSRVAGLFSGRGYNIHSLNVAPCEDPKFSRMTIDVKEDNEKLDQVIKQLTKLVNVVEVIDFRNEPSFYREIVLVRVRFGEHKTEILQLCDMFRAQVIDATREMLTIEISGGEFRLNRFLDLLGDYDVDMVTRSGKIAVVNNPRDTQVLNLRQSASLDAKVLDYYRNGVKVTILSAGDTWHKVQVEDGKIGYMMAKYLKVTNEESTVKPFQAKVINVKGGSYVNFRKAGSLNAKIIDRIDVGTSVTVIEHGTDWCKVVIDGVEGYMSTWFLKW